MKLSRIVRLALGPTLRSMMPFGVERKGGHREEYANGASAETPTTTRLWVRGLGTVCAAHKWASGRATRAVRVPGGQVELDVRTNEVTIGFKPSGGSVYSVSYVALRNATDYDFGWYPKVFDRRIGDLRVQAVRGADVEAHVRAKHGGKKTPYEELVDVAASALKAN